MSRFIALTSMEGIRVWVCATAVTRAWQDPNATVVDIGGFTFMVKERLEVVLTALETQDAAYRALRDAADAVLEAIWPRGGWGSGGVTKVEDMADQIRALAKAHNGRFS